jgi:hypothetical protein
VLNKTAFEYMTNLQYKMKDLTEQVRAFKSGEKYQKLVKFFEEALSVKDRIIKSLKLELAEIRAQYIDVRNNWLEVTEDLEAEHTKEIRQKNRFINTLQKALLKAQNTIDDLKDKLLQQKKELYKVQTELEDEKGKVLKLKAQIKRDHENSSKPSSQAPNRKKITNNRVVTGRKPGGQKGHKGHVRKQHTPTNTLFIPPPEKYRDNPDYKLTGRIIKKQKIGIKISLVVDEYQTAEYRYVPTGQRVHAEFPEGLVNEVSYDESIKAFAFLLNNSCNVSIDKTSEFLRALTGGELKISKGMINGLAKAFSAKSAPMQQKAFADMLLSPVMGTDFTAARVNGKNMNVLVCATETGVLYFAREHKGHAGVKDSPVELYQFTLVHDHDKTFYKYGDKHQECLEHVLRYLKDSIDNEKNLTWNSLMHNLIGEMIHFRKGFDSDETRNPIDAAPDEVAAFIKRYDDILATAALEYDYEPPNMKYYPDGFNLFKRLRDYKENHLLFLHDIRVPHTNNFSERLLRVFKRKQQQVMCFRSFGSLEDLCHSLGVLATISANDENIYDAIASIFKGFIPTPGSSLVA